MLPYLVALAVTTSPTPCPADLLVADPRLKLVHGERGYNHEIISVNVTNRGSAAQTAGTHQRLDLVQNGTVIGSQPIPVLGSQQSYPASFRLVVVRQRKRAPVTVQFRYVLENGADAARQNCTSVNDVLDATL